MAARCGSILIKALALFASLAGPASAATIYEQSLDSWSSGYCTPCFKSDPSDPDKRLFASFSLSQGVILDGGRFAVLDFTPSTQDDINISIWDSPFGNELFSADFAEGGYLQEGSASTHWAVVDLPDWSLGPGDYWISFMGTNGNLTSWGSDLRVGDDLYYLGESDILSSDRYVGFSLQGEVQPSAVPVPGTLGLLALGLAGLGLVGRRRAA